MNPTGKHRTTNKPNHTDAEMKQESPDVKHWTNAEPNLPPETVDWEHLFSRIADDDKMVAWPTIVDAVGARHYIPQTIAEDAVAEAVDLGLLIEDPDDPLLVRYAGPQVSRDKEGTE